MTSLEDIQEEIDELQEVKTYHKSTIKKNPRVKKDIIKNVNKKLKALYKWRTDFHADGTGIRGDPTPNVEIVTEEGYTYKPPEKKKSKNTKDRKREKQSAMAQRLLRRKMKNIM